MRSFFRMVALREPDSIGIVTRVLAIPMKREDRKLIGNLTRTEMQALLAAPDRSKWSGRRDYALLLTLYNKQIPENLSRKGCAPIIGEPRGVTRSVYIFVVFYSGDHSYADPQTALSP